MASTSSSSTCRTRPATSRTASSSGNSARCSSRNVNRQEGSQPTIGEPGSVVASRSCSETGLGLRVVDQALGQTRPAATSVARQPNVPPGALQQFNGRAADLRLGERGERVGQERDRALRLRHVDRRAIPEPAHQVAARELGQRPPRGDPGERSSPRRSTPTRPTAFATGAAIADPAGSASGSPPNTRDRTGTPCCRGSARASRSSASPCPRRAGTRSCTPCTSGTGPGSRAAARHRALRAGPVRTAPSPARWPGPALSPLPSTWPCTRGTWRRCRSCGTDRCSCTGRPRPRIPPTTEKDSRVRKSGAGGSAGSRRCSVIAGASTILPGFSLLSGSNKRLYLPHRVVQRFAEDLPVELAARQPVAVLAGVRAAVLGDQVLDLLGDRAHGGHAVRVGQVDERPDVQAADRTVPVEPGGQLVPVQDRLEPRGVLGEVDRDRRRCPR